MFWQYFKHVTFVTACVELIICNVLSVLLCGWYTKCDARDQLYRATARQGKEKICIWAFYDSGNGLLDPYFGAPVVLASQKVLETLGLHTEHKLLIPFYSLGESDGWINGYMIDEIEIAYKSEKKHYRKIVVADAATMFERNQVEYDLILHRSMR